MFVNVQSFSNSSCSPDLFPDLKTLLAGKVVSCEELTKLEKGDFALSKKIWNIGCNFLLNSNLFHLGHSCACLAVHLSCKEFSSNSDDCLLMRLEQQKLLIFSLKGRDLLIRIINGDKAILLLQLCYSWNVLHNLILSSTIITMISKYQSRLADWCAPWCARHPQCWLPVENRLVR